MKFDGGCTVHGHERTRQQTWAVFGIHKTQLATNLNAADIKSPDIRLNHLNIGFGGLE
jgi:hypothetical protein